MIVTFFCYDHENFVTKKRRCGVSKYTESFGKWFNPFDEKLGQASKAEAIQYTFEHQQTKINELLEENKKLKDFFDGKPTHWSNVIYDKNKELDQLEERLEKYEEKAQRDDKKICGMGFKLHEVNERLRECEEALRFYAWASLHELEENDQVQISSAPNVWANGKRARAYFKKYEGK